MKRKILTAVFAAIILCLTVVGLAGCYPEPYHSKVTYGEFEFSAYAEEAILTGFTDPEATQAFIPETITIFNDTTYDVPVTGISASAFKDNKTIQRVVIPATVDDVFANAFSGCTSLIIIDVAAGNPVYRSAGNCIIDIAEKCVVAGCRSSKIPTDGSVESIGEGAFSGHRLTDFSIPSTVTAISAGAFKNCTFTGGITLSQNLKALGENCFEGSNLTQINLPASATEISDAFVGCDMLENITVDGNNAQFSSEAGIMYNKDKTEIILVPQAKSGKVVLPDGINALPSSAFSGREKLEELVINRDIVKIEEGALSGCTSLESLTAPIAVVDSSRFNGEFYFYKNNFAAFFGEQVPKSLKTVQINKGILGGYYFSECTNLENVILDEDVKEIGYSAIYKCTALKRLEIKGAQKIAALPFGGSTNLETLIINDTLEEGIENLSYLSGNKFKQLTVSAKVAEIISSTTKDGIKAEKLIITSGKISPYAFRFCKIEELSLGDGVTEVGWGAFANCTTLKKVELGGNLTKIDTFDFPKTGAYALEYNTYEGANYLGNELNPYYFLVSVADKNAASYKIHPNTRIIGGSVFNNCENLTEITIPDKVITISYRAFYNCGFEKVILPQSVKIIDDGAFGFCLNLKYFFIPSGVEYIGEYPSNSYHAFTDVYYEGTKEELSAIYHGELLAGDSPPFGLNIYYYSENQPETEGKFWHYVDGEIIAWQA